MVVAAVEVTQVRAEVNFVQVKRLAEVYRLVEAYYLQVIHLVEANHRAEVYRLLEEYQVEAFQVQP